jgi:hypothetical protein
MNPGFVSIGNIHEHLEWPDDGSTYEPKHVVNG